MYTGWPIVNPYTFLSKQVPETVTFQSEEIFYSNFLHWNSGGINCVCGKFCMQCYFYQDQILRFEKIFGDGRFTVIVKFFNFDIGYKFELCLEVIIDFSLVGSFRANPLIFDLRDQFPDLFMSFLADMLFNQIFSFPKKGNQIFHESLFRQDVQYDKNRVREVLNGFSFVAKAKFPMGHRNLIHGIRLQHTLKSLTFIFDFSFSTQNIHGIQP